MAITMQVQGIPNAVKFITKKKLGVKVGVTEGMIKGAEELKKEVKASIQGRKAEPRSVDTGALNKSVNVATTATSATIYSDVEHAKFIEYGTIKIPARRHFRNSMDRNRNKVVTIVQGAVNSKV